MSKQFFTQTEQQSILGIKAEVKAMVLSTANK